jgi:hypothetical protein
MFRRTVLGNGSCYKGVTHPCIPEWQDDVQVASEAGGVSLKTRRIVLGEMKPGFCKERGGSSGPLVTLTHPESRLRLSRIGRPGIDLMLWRSRTLRVRAIAILMTYCEVDS